MRRLFWTLIWVALIYSLYWFGVSQLLQTGVQRASAVLAEDGVDLTVGSVTTTGYPARFHTDLRDLRLVHPDWTWQAPQVRLQADSYRPLTVDVTFPQEQIISVAEQELRVSSDDGTAAVTLRPTGMLGLDRASLAITQMQVMSDAGWQLGLGQVTARLVHMGGPDAVYDVDFGVAQVTLPSGLLDQIDPDGSLGAELQSIAGAAHMTLAAPLDRNVQGSFPDIDHLDLRDLQVAWGPVMAEMSGEIAINAAGVPSGQIILRSGQWQILLAVLTRAGVIDERVATTMTRVARFMADADGVLSVPVAFRDGVMLVGPVPVGPAPVLR
ncbi:MULTISPECIES: DUF2125 domain-containing protein [unclassified Yoonia]|uniref:DUF2125 domain-containing protein n=1 Tax=unclassified Yoonia TaxID=2629118 RepID=UPI002AFEE8CD|nr:MULTISPECIES: DUF2125 domain-containing protein [unclassified Yoonia]